MSDRSGRPVVSDDAVEQKGAEILSHNEQRAFRSADRLLSVVAGLQWCVVALMTLSRPPGAANSSGDVATSAPVLLVTGAIVSASLMAAARLRPGSVLTRQMMAIGQMLWSVLLMRVTSTVVETNLHAFGLLVLLSLYGDVNVLCTAAVFLVANHALRLAGWFGSVYGGQPLDQRLFVAHSAAGAVVLGTLLVGTLRNRREMRSAARREALLAVSNERVERAVRERSRELAESQKQLMQAQKLESMGRLTAGVAHEINTPIQFVSDSLVFLREAQAQLADLLRAYRSVLPKLDGDAAETIARAEKEADLEYLMENVPSSFDRTLDGLSRVASIVRSMKEFAHPDPKEKTITDINAAVRSTLIIARNEYKYVADVQTDFADIPSVPCYPGELNQVVLNIVVNAAHAIADRVNGSDARGKITVTTREEGDHVVISIADTGGGIPDGIRAHIFEPFFTTKEAGRGTGQGLAIAHSLVVEKHGGALTFDTELGRGTTFFIKLPLEAAERPDAKVA